jgi:hypothetical protein
VVLLGGVFYAQHNPIAFRKESSLNLLRMDFKSDWALFEGARMEAMDKA